MKLAFSPFVKSLFVALLAASSMSVAAQGKSDPARGEMLYNKGDASRGITACMACHGASGNSTISQNPKLAAQHETYTVKQLRDFTTPLRKNPVMTAIASAMNEQDMRDVAAYLSLQAPKPGAARNKETVELGKKIYRAGIVEKGVPACAACHSPSGAGIPGKYPRLAGQHQDYTAAQLVKFRNGERLNSEQMTTIAKRMSDDEIQAVSDYIAGLQ
jgi:cytochrome c553